MVASLRGFAHGPRSDSSHRAAPGVKMQGIHTAHTWWRGKAPRQLISDKGNGANHLDFNDLALV